MTVDGSRPRLSTNPFCAWCGAGQIENARFCPGCGRSVAAASSVPDRPPHAWLHDEVLQDEQPGGEELWDEELWDEEPTTLLESLGGRRDEAASSPRPRSGRGPRQVRPSRIERPASLRGASRRWVMIVAVGVVVLLLVSAAGTIGLRYFEDRPVRDAFDTAQRSYAPLVAAMAGVSDMDEVAAVGERFAEVHGSLEAQLREVAARDTRLAGAVEAVLTAQVAVADAGAHLADLDGDDLDGWGPAHQALRDAFGNLESATDALSSVDTDAAAEVADGDDAMRGLESVVGAEVAESAESTLVGLLEQLDEAKVTEDVRATASEAAAEASAVETALPGVVEGSADANRLEAIRGVHARLARLAVLDADHLEHWGTLRAPLERSLAALPARSPAQHAGEAAVASVNRLVRRAQARLGDWRAQYDAAVADRASDAETLEEYRSGMDAQLRAYSALRADLSEWIARVEEPGSTITYDEGYSVLSEAQWDRQTVRDAMNDLVVPEEVQAAHVELVGVVDDAVAAVQSAYDGTADSDNCVTSCYYKDTPGWQLFSAESSRITDAYDAAVGNWKAVTADAEAAIASRPLPEQPVI